MIERVGSEDCPDAELLAAYLEQRVDAPTRDTIERHVSRCAICLEVAATVLADDAAVPAEIASPIGARAAGRGEERRVLRGAIAAGLAFVVTGAIAYTAAQLAFRGMAHALATRASAAVGDPVDIGTLHLALSPRNGTVAVGLDRILIGDSRHARSSADALEVSLGLAPLVRGHTRVDGFRLIRPVVRVTLASAAGGRERDAVAPRDLAHVAALASLAPVELVDGTLIIERGPAPPIQLDAVDGTITPHGDALQMALTAKIGAGELSASGSVGLDPAGTLDLDLHARGVDAAAFAPLGVDTAGVAGVGGVDVAVRLIGPALAPSIIPRAPAPPTPH